MIPRRANAAAPDFSEAPYPSRGEKLGPAWQAVWDELHVAHEACGSDLAELMCDAAPGLTRRAALVLLEEACAAGWVYGRRARGAYRTATWYRLTWAARRIEELTR